MSPFACMMLICYLCGLSAVLGDCDEAKLAESRELLAWADQRCVMRRGIFLVKKDFVCV